MESLPKPKKRPQGVADEDEISARPHDPLVASVMEEEQASKRAKKGGRPPGAKKGKNKGLTLEEVEKLEGGTVKESQVGMAASRRADRRKQRSAGEGTDMLAVDDLVDVEEALEQEEEYGFKLEPFNLAKEREEGHFDEGGNYVENEEEDDPALNDAWLTSAEAAVLSAKERKRVEAEKARMASADAAPEITAKQAADLMRRLIEILKPQESAMKALKRLRPQSLNSGKAGKWKDKKQKVVIEAAKNAQEGPEQQQKQSFEDLTEVAATLLDAGELDIYSMSREEVQRRADEHPAERDDLDMFGDEPSVPQSSAGAATQTTANAVNNKAALPRVPQAAKPQPEVDYDSWPVKELIRFLKERGRESSALTEKSELVAKVREVAAEGPEGEQPVAPPGYIFDPSSGFFYNSEAAMYYDGSSGSFYTPSDGKWWKYNEKSGQYSELQAAE